MAASIVWLGSGAAQAVLINPGFETGNFTGWSTYVPSDASASVVASFGSYSPVEGSRFAVLKTDGPGSYTTASQTLSLAAGQTVSGWAAFDYGDYHPFNDNAYVRILGSGSALIATPWAVSGLSVPDYANTPWTAWSWTAAAAGTYTVQYGNVNGGDSINDSYALFDAGQVSAVPEAGSTLALLGFGLIGLAGMARRVRKA